MDREIKFRLRIGNKVVGYERWTLAGWFYSTDGLCDWNDKYIYHTDKDQFTGRHDTKGVEIYKGDIISSYCDGRNVFGPVVWLEKYAQYGIQEKDGFVMTWGLPENEPQVLGNIFQNPDLLTGRSSEREEKA